MWFFFFFFFFFPRKGGQQSHKQHCLQKRNHHSKKLAWGGWGGGERRGSDICANGVSHPGGVKGMEVDEGGEVMAEPGDDVISHAGIPLQMLVLMNERAEFDGFLQPEQPLTASLTNVTANDSSAGGGRARRAIFWAKGRSGSGFCSSFVCFFCSTELSATSVGGQQKPRRATAAPLPPLRAPDGRAPAHITAPPPHISQQSASTNHPVNIVITGPSDKGE